jgi:putative transposase
MSAYIEAHRARFEVEPICRALGVAPSSFYAHRSRPPSAQALADAWLVGQIHAAREGHRRVYGVRKTWREFSRRGVEVGRDRVGRLMAVEGLAGVRRGQRHRTTTPAESAAERARDLVERRFAAAPNRLWVAPHLPAHLRGLRVPRLHPRCLQPPDRRLADRHPHAHRAGDGHPRDGGGPARP